MRRARVSLPHDNRHNAGSPRDAGCRSRCHSTPAPTWRTCLSAAPRPRRHTMSQPDGEAAVRAVVDAASDVKFDPTAEITRLAALPEVDYEIERKEAAARLGFRTSA